MEEQHTEENDKVKKAGHLAGTVIVWALALAVVWILLLGMYALTMWVYEPGTF